MISSEDYISLARRVISGEISDQAATVQLVATSQGDLNDFTAAGVLELYLVTESNVRQASNLQAGSDAYEARQQHKRRLAEQVVNYEMTLAEAAQELGIETGQVSAVLGAYQMKIYGPSVRNELLALANAPLDFISELAQSVKDTRRDAAPGETTDVPDQTAGPTGPRQPGRPNVIPFTPWDTPGPTQGPSR
jgi:hypothetical protein